MPIEHHVYRVSVLTAFLKAGIPMNKLSCFRSLMEMNGLRLTDRSHMANLIPFVLENEKTQLKLELGTKDIAVVLEALV